MHTQKPAHCAANPAEVVSVHGHICQRRLYHESQPGGFGAGRKKLLLQALLLRRQLGDLGVSKAATRSELEQSATPYHSHKYL